MQRNNTGAAFNRLISAVHAATAAGFTDYQIGRAVDGGVLGSALDAELEAVSAAAKDAIAAYVDAPGVIQAALNGELEPLTPGELGEAAGAMETPATAAAEAFAGAETDAQLRGAEKALERLDVAIHDAAEHGFEVDEITAALNREGIDKPGPGELLKEVYIARLQCIANGVDAETVDGTAVEMIAAAGARCERLTGATDSNALFEVIDRVQEAHEAGLTETQMTNAATGVFDTNEGRYLHAAYRRALTLGFSFEAVSETFNEALSMAREVNEDLAAETDAENAAAVERAKAVDAAALERPAALAAARAKRGVDMLSIESGAPSTPATKHLARVVLRAARAGYTVDAILDVAEGALQPSTPEPVDAFLRSIAGISNGVVNEGVHCPFDLIERAFKVYNAPAAFSNEYRAAFYR